MFFLYSVTFVVCGMELGYLCNSQFLELARIADKEE